MPEPRTPLRFASDDDDAGFPTLHDVDDAEEIQDDDAEDYATSMRMEAAQEAIERPAI